MFGRFSAPSLGSDTYLGINLGDLCEDTLTGFKGVVVARSEFLTGCAQVCLLPRAGDDGKAPDPNWYDVTRLVLVEAGHYALPERGAAARATQAGGGPPPPFRRNTPRV